MLLALVVHLHGDATKCDTAGCTPGYLLDEEKEVLASSDRREQSVSDRRELEAAAGNESRIV